MSEMKIVFKPGLKDHACSILKRFNQMRQEEKMCDVVIIVGTARMKVHRDILAAASDYFFAMFTHDTLEKENGFVEMKQVSSSAVSKCLDYIYTGEFETFVDELDDLFFVIKMLQLDLVEQRFSSLLESYLDVEAFIKIRQVALKYGLKELDSKCNMFAIENLDLLVDSGCVALFEFDYVSYLLSSNLLFKYGYNEDGKLAVIIHWIKNDMTNRRDKLIALTKLLKLENISHSCWKYLFETEEICNSSADFMKMAFLSVLNDQVKSLKPSCNRYIGNTAILNFDADCNAAQLYMQNNGNIVSERVVIDTSPLREKGKSVFVCTDTRIYILSLDRSVYELELGSFTFKKRNNMLCDHRYMRATIVSGYIYTCGSNLMERYNIAHDNWEIVDKSSVSLYGCELITYNGQLMTIGGDAGFGTPTGEVNVLNTTTDKWSKLPSLIVARKTAAAAALSASVFVVGGYANSQVLRDVEFYSASTNLWTLLSQTNHPHDEFQLFVMKNMLYTLGGRIGYAEAETYDIDTNQWADFELLNTDCEKNGAIGLSNAQLVLLLQK